MDLEHELSPTPKKDQGPPSPTPRNVKQLEFASHGWQVVSSQGNLSLLRTLQEVHKTNLEKNHPMGGDSPEPPEPPELKRFLLSDHDSHFLKLEELKQYIADAQRSVTLLDETDHSGAKLYDFIPEEAREEIEAQLQRLSSPENIKKSLQTDINSLAPELWEDHKKIKKALTKEHCQESEALLLGKTTSEKNRERLQALLTDEKSQEIQEVCELVCLEKCRVALAALTASPKSLQKKTQEAQTFLGNDFALLSAQTKHMEALLQKDWQTALEGDWGEGVPPIINPTQGKSLICSEILSKMESPSEFQIKILEDMYSTMAYSLPSRQDKAYPKEQEEDNKIAFLLASMSLLEEGKKARSLQKMETLEQEILLENPDSPEKDEEETLDPLDDLHKLRRVKSREEELKRGLIKTLKGVGHKALAYGATASLHKLKHAWDENDPKVQEYIQHLQKADGQIDHTL
jgi:hypothetical protein